MVDSHLILQLILLAVGVMLILRRPLRSDRLCTGWHHWAWVDGETFLGNSPYRITHVFKGGGSGAAVAEQKKARKTSEKQFKKQMKEMEKQREAAESVKTPRFLPAAPAASMSEDVDEAGRDLRRRNRRRFGVGQTTLAGESQSVLGGAVPLGS